MRKLLFCALFGLASLAKAQSWDTLTNTWARLDGGDFVAPGTVTSVGISAPVELNVSGSPVTTSGTLGLAWASQNQNLFLGSPDNASGILSMRAVKPRDLGAAAAVGLILQATSATAMDFLDPMADATTADLGHEDFCGVSRASFNPIGAGTFGNTTTFGGTGGPNPCVRILSTTAAAATGGALVFVNTAGAPSSFISYGAGPITLAGTFSLSSIGDGTDLIKVFFGLCNTIADAAECTNGIYLMYDRAVNTTNWLICTAKASVYTRTDTGIAVAVASMITPKIFVNAAGTSITCSISGVACSTPVSTNIPTAGTGFMVKLDKTAGATTTFTMTLDYLGGVQHGLAR